MKTLPEFQLATEGRQFPRGLNWVCEPKYDGVRLGCVIDGRQTRWFSRETAIERLDFLAEDLPRLAGRVYFLDGEFCYGDGSRAAYSLLARSRICPLGEWYVFDVIDLSSRAELPLKERKKALRKIVPEKSRHVRLADDLSCGDCQSPGAFFDRMRASGMEGMVMKRLDKPYKFGVRSRDWLKYK